MTCSLQGIAMRQKPVHGRHSRIKLEREWGEPTETGKRKGRKGASRVSMAPYFILGSLRLEPMSQLRFGVTAGYFDPTEDET